MNYWLTFYWDRGVSEGAAGTTRGPLIFLREAYRDDYGLYRHELIHAWQFWVVSIISSLMLTVLASRLTIEFPVIADFQVTFTILGFAVHALLYTLYPRYRLAAEVMAYREQLKHYSDDRTVMFAGFIADCYRLDYQQSDIEEMLRK